MRHQTAARAFLGFGALAAAGLAAGLAAGARSGGTGAEVVAHRKAKAAHFEPVWNAKRVSVHAGKLLQVRLDPRVATSCRISALGPYEGQAVRWTLKSFPLFELRLRLHTNANATPGRWRLTATCTAPNSVQARVAVLRVHLLGRANGHKLLASRRSLHVKRVAPHAQASGSKAKQARATPVVRVHISAAGRGGRANLGDDYPAKWKNRPQDSVFDDWREYNRECTSFVAWALASRNHFSMPFFDNAIGWGPDAQRRGYRVDRRPAVGSVAWSNRSPGHVAYVVAASGGAVIVEEYNYLHRGGWDRRGPIPASSFTGFIHFKDLEVSPPPPTPTSTATHTVTVIQGGGNPQPGGSNPQQPPPATTTPPPATTTPPPATTTPPPADTTPPSTPGGLTASGATTSTVNLTWSGSSDNVGVSGYSVYVNGNRFTNAPAVSTTVTGLTCGTSYSFAVDAYDAAGNHSGKASTSGSTAACPKVADTTPPSEPTGFAQTDRSSTAVRVAWNSSTDNVGVAGYDLYLNGNKVSGNATSSYVIGNLSCGHSYTVGVDAYDAAGNHSGQAQSTASTAACPPPKSVSVSKGSHVTTSFCTAAACAYMVISFSGFSSGSHSVTCYGSYPPSGAFYSYTTSATTSAVCIFGYSGYQVWATVDGVSSGKITW